MLDKVSNEGSLSFFDYVGPDSSEESESSEGATLGDHLSNIFENDTGPIQEDEDLKNAISDAKNSAEKFAKDRSWEVVSSASKFGDPTFGLNGNSILRATAQNITNEGGSGNMIGCQNENSMFDKSRNIDSQRDGGEDIKLERQETSERRIAQNNEYIEANLPSVDPSDLIGNPSSIVGVSGNRGNTRGFGIAAHNMSMFDTEEFQRLTPTKGEGMNDRATEAQSKTDAVVNELQIREAGSTRDITNNLVDNFTNQKPSDGRRNRREESVDRLYNAIIGENK